MQNANGYKRWSYATLNAPATNKSPPSSGLSCQNVRVYVWVRVVDVLLLQCVVLARLPGRLRWHLGRILGVRVFALPG